MFENPIKGSVGGACKKLTGMIYGCAWVAIFVYTALVLIALITNADVLYATGLISRPTVHSDTYVIWRIAIMLVVDAGIWVCGYINALIWNIVGEIVNSLALIAHRMPKGASKE